jgi:hypothetical protein
MREFDVRAKLVSHRERKKVMARNLLEKLSLAGAMLLMFVCVSAGAQIIINHNNTDIAQVPSNWVNAAKSNLHIAYGHTSHGSQVTSNMTGLVEFMNGLGYEHDLYAWAESPTEGYLDLDDYFAGTDLGAPDFTNWESETRTYLENSENADVNVVMWSWCGQVSWASEANIDTYLSLMSGLEEDYPDITFVYMTGHLDGTGASGTLNINNNHIRTYCQTNHKVLFDFNDIECYDPDGLVNYLPLFANDNCDYDSDGDETQDTNWATVWQNAHTENVDWYACDTAHSQSLNGNRKAYAAWWLWARLAGWTGPSTTTSAAPSWELYR